MLYLIRHAEAEEAGKGGDAARRLTERGRDRMRAAAQGLGRIVNDLQVIAHSPLVRATETARIVADRFPDASVTELHSLLPGADPASLLEWLARQEKSVAVVGHEPMLSYWIGYAVGGLPRPVVQMKKSAVCALELPHPVAAGAGQIHWLMTWRQLAAQS